jgi:NADH dehydrogenase
VIDGNGGSRRLELAGPDRLTYDQIAHLIAPAAGRDRPLFHVPIGVVHLGLAALRRAVGDAVFATWEEAELMEVPMVSERGTADAEALGVEPRPMREVLGVSR